MTNDNAKLTTNELIELARRRCDELMGATEESNEEAELDHWATLLDEYGA